MSWYLSVLPGEQTAFAETEKLTGFLAAFPELQQKSPVSFGPAPEYPWIDIVLVRATGENYASDLTFIPVFNHVTITASSREADHDYYEMLAGRIAEFLGWLAINDEDRAQVWPQANQ